MKAGMLILASLLLMAGAVAAQQRGDWVLGQWRGGDFWFPGVVESRDGNAVTIAYDDGTRETLPLKLVRPYTWRVGTRIECRWADGSEWYGADITGVSKDGTIIDVRYDDGIRERIATGGCRSR
jgi:hypothetical protein